MRTCSKIVSVLALFLISLPGIAQISSGHILFERKTNLYKRLRDPRVADYIPEAQKIKTEQFELYFSDSASHFAPIESELKDPFEWATTKDEVYQNFRSGERLTIKDIVGTQSNVADSIRIRTWKIVPGKRKICGYDCQKALWIANDSTNIYAWYANELSVSTGPESFNGLPGVILGLATEDGSIKYFAKEVLLERVTAEQLTPKKVKGKVYTSQELKDKLLKEYGDEKERRDAVESHFSIW